MPSWLKRVRTIFRRGSMERELDIELQFHLDMLAAEYVRRGIPPDAARRSARQTFGGVESIKDGVRDAWLTRLVETIGQDVRYGLRGLRRQAGYALAVIVTMALGIGANTAIFSVVNAVVLRPLPYDRGEDLLLLNQARTNVANTGFSFADIDDIKALSGSLDAVVEYHNMYFILLGGEEPERVAAGVVSWDYFQTLGITPLVGRVFRADDDGHGKHDTQATLVLSHEYWQRAFRGDRNVVGRVVEMNDRPHTIVGVLPDVPMYPQPNDVYMPRSACPFRMSADGTAIGAAAGWRLRSAAAAPVGHSRTRSRTWQRSGSGCSRLTRSLYPAERGYQLTATPLRREFTRNFESTLLILVSTAGFVLLIVCASVANLAVARTMRRDRELALRTALGASQGRLLRQLATESLILALVGGACGLLLAFVGMDLLVQYAGRFTPRATEVRIDTAVLLFTLGVSLLTGIIAAILPAVSRRLGPRRAAISAGPRRLVHRSDLRRALIVAQVAASFVLLIGAGLMVRSLLKLTGVDPGFSSDHVLTMQIDMNFTKYRTLAERAAYLDRLLLRLQQIPGVATVGASGTIPFLEEAGGALNSLLVTGRAGQKSDDIASGPRASLMIASDDYFRAMDIRLIKGRFFAPSDSLGSPGVALVNRTFAERNWPEEDPVGQRVSSNGGRTWFTIVGIVADVRQQLALEPVDEIYAPMRQMPYVTTNWVIRSTVDPVELDSLVRKAVRETDRDQPIHRLRTLDDVRAASLAPPRLTTTLLGLFAALALIITAAGIAGVIAFSVSQRTQEFGVRVALGAKRSDVVSMVVGEGVRLAITGLAIGLVGAVILGALLSTVLFGVGPVDAVTYLAVSMVLLAVAGLACLLPALRAASIDPMTALRVV